MIVFYGQTGEAIAYCDDEKHIFLFSGDPVAYLDSDAVFSYRGILLGWFEMGWLRDTHGRCVAFSNSSSGGPPHPERKAMPMSASKRSLPSMERQDPRTLRPIHSNAWAAQSTLDFFVRSPHRWPGNLGGNLAAK